MLKTSHGSIEALLAKTERSVAGAIRNFLKDVRSDKIREQVFNALQVNDPTAALAILNSLIYKMASAIAENFSVVGRATAAELDALAQTLPKVALAISFDSTSPRAAQLMADNRLRFITEFTETQRDATRAALTRAFNTGAGPREAAQAFSDSIGLTVQQEGYIANRRDMLENLDRRALDSQLRDRRLDPQLENAIELRRPLTDLQIETQIERQRANAIDLRAETIARTESLTMLSIAQDEAIAQMVDDVPGLDSSNVTRVWNVTLDSRTREFHASMEGQEVGLDEPFVDGQGNELMYPGDRDAPPETVINCRCTLTFSIDNSAIDPSSIDTSGLDEFDPEALVDSSVE